MKPGLTELAAVLAVARQRNFRAAADDLGMSRSALSHAVSALERRIGPRQSFAVVGSAAYFRKYPKPKSPADLKDHLCIRRRLPSGSIFRWEFERRGERFLVDVNGVLTLDEPALVQKAALAGLGLAYLNLLQVHPDIKRNRLVRVLDEWTEPFDGICLYYPGRRHVPAPLRALIDLVKEIRSGKLREK